MFLWHSELRKEGYSVVNSEEFDHSTADEYLQLMPPENWILHVRDSRDQLVSFDSEGRKLGKNENAGNLGEDPWRIRHGDVGPRRSRGRMARPLMSFAILQSIGPRGQLWIP